MCVSIEEHFEIHYSQGDYNACILLLERMSLSPEELAEAARKITNKQLEDGTHNFQKPEFQKINAMRRVKEGTHHWLGERNPSHKRLQEGTHNFQKSEKKKCEYCKKEVDIGNYALYHGEFCFSHTGIKSPGAIKIAEIERDFAKNTVWITNGIENKRIQQTEVIPSGFYRGRSPYNTDNVKLSCKNRLGVAQKKVECPNCGKIGGISTMKRWHFDNCRNGK
jgi:predicted RNA-binding Zn-ribbon protein involved in translation (DUF1610 family)